MDPASVKLITVVVTFNGSRWIGNCLGSLLASTEETGIVVVDNASTDDGISLIREKFPQVSLIVSPKNLGFGQANNIGIDLALRKGASHVFLLNQDAWVFPDTLGKLLRAISADPTAGLMSPLHYDGSGRDLDVYFEKYLQAARIAYPPRPGPGQSEETSQQADFVNAAAWLLTTESIRKTGGFAPIFPHYGEDVNFCQRLYSKGFSIHVHASAKICHDRKERLLVSGTGVTLEKEWIHFLTQACDIRTPGFGWMALKRWCRHFILLIASIIRGRPTRMLHAKMCQRIPKSFRAIHRTRNASRFGIMPFLTGQ